MTMQWAGVLSVTAAGVALASGLALAAGQYGSAVDDTEIKIGNTVPYSGPASAYGAVGKADASYFAMINDQGGINGRKIKFISRDDGYSPPKTVELVRKLVEEDQVLLMFSTVGTPPNSAIRSYLNDNRVPQLFLASGASKWDDPKHFPWTMGWLPTYRNEARIFARFILKTTPDAKIALLYQNDDFGKDYLRGLHDVLGERTDKMLVATQTYETTDPTVDSQISVLKASGANVLITAAIPKVAAQAIRKVYDIGWKPTNFIPSVSNSVGSVMRPAGLEKGIGVISAAFVKDPSDPQWQATPEYRTWLAWMKKYDSSANRADDLAVFGYCLSQTLVAVLKATGDNLTRANIMKQAASIHDLKLPMLLPDITVSTSADDFAPIRQMQLERFDGTGWKLFGSVLSGSGS